MRELTTKTVAALAIVGLVVASAGPALADYGTAPVLDTSTTDDTTSVSELQAGDTLGNNNTFSANSSENTTVQWISNSNETKAVVYRQGNDWTAWSDSNPTQVSYNATDSDSHFNGTFTHAALLDSDHQAGANVTMKVKTTNNTTVASPDTNTETFYVEWDNSTNVYHVSAADVESDDDIEVLNESGPLGVSSLGEDESTIEATDRTVNGSNTDVYVTFSSSNVSEDFAAAADGEDTAAKLSGFSLTRNVVLVEDADGEIKAVPVYNGEAPDDVKSSDTYAVYASGDFGGSDGVKVNLGDDYEDADEVSVTAAGSAGLTDYIRATTNAGVSNLMG